MKKHFLAAIGLLAAIVPAEAAHRGTNAPILTQAPVLQNQTIVVGRLTPSGRNASRLNSQSFTVPAYKPVTYKGIDLLSPTSIPCDTWKRPVFVSNTAGRTGADWTLIADNTPEGTSAIIPVPSSTGANHLDGDYVFTVQCTGGGNLSNTVQLTLNTVADKVSIGQNDRTDFGNFPSGFGNTPGQGIIFSRGSDWHTVRWSLTLGNYANQVTIEPAEANGSPYFSNMALVNGSNIWFRNFVASGDTDISGVNYIFRDQTTGTNTLHDVLFDNLNYYGKLQFIPRSSNNSGQGTFSISSCTSNCKVQDSSASWVIGGYSNMPNTEVSNVYISYFTNNCTFLATGRNDAPFKITNFSTCASPAIMAGGNHVDAMQVADTSSPDGITVRNFWSLQAAGTDEAQGPIFGGGPFSGTGYIDDGTAAHGPGVIMTLVTGSPGNGAGSMHVQVPGYITPEDLVYWASSTGGQKVLTLTNFAPAVIGSPASPVAIYGVTPYNFHMDGIVSTNSTFRGWTASGQTGTSWFKHFGYVMQDANPPQITSYTGTIDSNTQLTVLSVPTTNRPNESEPFVQGGGRLRYSGGGGASCTWCGVGVAGQQTSTEDVQAVGVGTITISGQYPILTLTSVTSGNFLYNLSNGSHTGGLMLEGTGVRPGLSVAALTSGTGGAGSVYRLCDTNGTGCTSSGAISTGSITISGRPLNMRGTYRIGPNPPAPLPVGPITISNTGGFPVGRNSGAGVYDGNCSTVAFHGGTFVMGNGYGQNGASICGAPVTNSTKVNVITPVAADYQTGILPYDSLTPIDAPTWDAMTPVQQRAMVCNKMLPKVGGNLDLGGGNWIGPFTATGEIITEDGNVAVPQCGIH